LMLAVAGLLLGLVAVADGLQPTPQLRSTRRAVHVRSHALAIATPLSMPADGDGTSSNPTNPPLKVLYDGKCMVCLTNKAVLSFFDRRRTKLSFVDIRDDGYNPSSNAGVAFADAMRHLHVITADGQVSTGSEAVLQAYSKVGLGWLMAVLRFPLFRWLIDGAYAIVSRHRYTISKWLPGGTALASAVTQLKDVESAAMGLGCEDEEECMLDYDDEDEEE